MDLTPYIREPHTLNEITLQQLRRHVARYPYHQTARLLFLHNLFLLHDTSFSKELRRAAIFLPDRRKLHELVESPTPPGPSIHLRQQAQEAEPQTPEERHTSLIDQFLSKNTTQSAAAALRTAPPADPISDYTNYLLQLEDAQPDTTEENTDDESPENHRRKLLEAYLEKASDRIQLNPNPQHIPQLPAESDNPDAPLGEEYFTETLARIYIKQERYEKAIEIIKRINLNNPKKSVYFADQIRFLEKLLINSRHSKKEN